MTTFGLKYQGKHHVHKEEEEEEAYTQKPQEISE